METRTVHDPIIGADVHVSDRLVDRLRGKYACGPHLPNGNPEFGWRQFEAPPIQREAAQRIEELESFVREVARRAEVTLDDAKSSGRSTLRQISTEAHRLMK